MDNTYGQFCTVARGAEVLCERWTPLVVRELLCGSRRFNDLHRGVPRMSTSLLAQRLRRLEEFGVVRRDAAGRVLRRLMTAWRDGTTQLVKSPLELMQQRAAVALRSPAGSAQHSMTLTASPPRAVSLYLVFMSAPVSRMVLITWSSDT